MNSGLILRLTGPFEAHFSDGSRIDGLSLRGQAILAYLARQPGQSATRNALAALIWGDRGDEQARASLRQELSKLRRLLPDGTLEASRNDVRLLRTTIDPAVENGSEFLSDFGLNAPEFEDWLREQRVFSREQRCRERIATGVAALKDADPEGATKAARLALQIDPSSEPAMQLLLRAAIQLEDRAAAIQDFVRFRDHLDSDLGVNPSAATFELVEALKGPASPAPARAIPNEVGKRTGPPVLAVLPFEELGASADDMFADGVVDEITATLSRVSDFDVIARQSSFALKGERLDHATVGRRLGANYLVEGTVRRSGDRVRINAQLVEVASGRVLWSDRFDEQLGDLFDLQDRIAESLGGAISPSLRTAEIHRAGRQDAPTRSVYELTLTAYPHIWGHQHDRNIRAIEILDEALELDPTYPVALALKAYCHAGECSYTWTRDPEADRAIAQDYVTRAIADSPDHAPTLVACASTTSMISNDITLAEDLNNRALWLDPNNAWAWTQAGFIANYTRDAETAIGHFERAERLSPLDPFRFTILFGKAAALVKHERYHEARDLVEEGIRMTTTATWAYRMLAAINTLAGDHEAAKRAAERLREAHPHITVEYLKACLPPNWSLMNPKWVDAMEAAGIPHN